MNHKSNDSGHKLHWQWLILSSLGLLAFGLGIWGFLLPTEPRGEATDLPDAIYHSLELFRTHFSYAGHPLPWELQVARFLAPLIMGFTVIKGFVFVAHSHRRTLLHRTKQGHVVICGLGRKGLQLAKKFREQGKWVVVIEKDANNVMLQQCEDEKIPCWIGDASQCSQLKNARVQFADVIIAVTGDDGKNVEIALRAAELCAGSKNVTRCFVHIVDPQLRGLFREHRIFTEAGGSFRATMFDFYENCALALFQTHALDGNKGIPSGSDASARLVIVSFGQMGESVLLQAARIGHFAEGKRLQATVIDQQATRLKQSFYRRYSHFDQTCEVNFLNFAVDSPEVNALIEQLRSEKKPILTFAVCCDEDTRAMTAALFLKSRLKERQANILVRMSSMSGLTTLLSDEDRDSSSGNDKGNTLHVPGVVPFGFLESICVPGAVLHEELDYLAMKIHQDFVNREVQRAKNEGVSPRNDAAVQKWANLEEDYKNSNRQQALHLQIKLRTISCRSSAPDKNGKSQQIQSNEEVVGDFSDEREIDLLAQMEHARWCADKLLSGWEFGEVRDDTTLKHPNLIPWIELDEVAKAKDHNSVRLIPQIVTVFRRNSQPKT